jgi:hypothetical protein
LYRYTEAFAHYRGKDMAADPELLRLFTLHLINAWDFAVIDSGVIDQVLKVVDSYNNSSDSDSSGAGGAGTGVGAVVGGWGGGGQGGWDGDASAVVVASAALSAAEA